MFIDSLPQLSQQQQESIEFTGDYLEYDQNLSDLAGSLYPSCCAKNYHTDFAKFAFLITELPKNPKHKCVIWRYRGEWVAKYFYKDWHVDRGYIEIDLPIPELTWRKNPDIDFSMTFYDSPLGNFEPDPWDWSYTMVWFMDPAFNPTEDKIWVMTCEVLGVSTGGTKDMGYLTPNVSVVYNEAIPKFEFELDQIMPPYWDLCYDCAYSLDKTYIKGDEKVWVCKISPNYRKTKDWKWVGEISVEPEAIYNLDYGILDYDLDMSQFDLDDLRYDCVFYFDRKHLEHDDDDDVWAFKLRWNSDPEGNKVKGYVSPNIKYHYNLDLKHLDIDYSFVQTRDFKLSEFFETLVWVTNPSKVNNNAKVWLVKAQMTSDSDVEKQVGFIDLANEGFDVFFISYDEDCAEENWRRVLKKAPQAQRIHGVKGIFEAHKQAASMAKSDMFWVVDADACLEPDWEFDYKPSIFEFNCVHVWRSRNPFIEETYGYGGVKLFPTEEVKQMQTWENDVTLSVGENFKLMNQISCTSKFNNNALQAYRSAYRECAKLSYKADPDSKRRLQAWLKPDKQQPFAAEVERGAKDGVAHFLLNHDMYLINNYEYLKSRYEQSFKVTHGR